MTGGLTPARRAAALVMLLFVTAAVYRGVIGNGFVYDDRVTVVTNPAVRSLARAPEWVLSPYAVTSDRGGKNYRPVTVASLALDYALWGGRAAGFHATNLVIHLLAVVFVYLLALRLWGTDLPALTAATWMALHPINAEAVNYISARSSTMAAAWGLVAVVCYDRWAEARAGDRRPAVGWLVAALGAGLLGFGSKESVTVLPLLIVVWDRARFGEASSWRASVTRSMPFWLVLGAWLGGRYLVVGATLGSGAVPDGWLAQWAAFAAKIVVTAAMHSVWPVGLAVDYGWPEQLNALSAAVALLAVGGLVVAGFGLGRIDRRLACCAGWFGVAMLPVLALPYITRIAMYQEHRVYLAEIGVGWLVGGVVAWGAPLVRRRIGVQFGAAAVGATLVIAAAWANGERTWVWGDAVRLWDDVLVRYPDSAVARNERGMRLLDAGQVDEAEQEFLAALRTLPRYRYTHLMLGMTYDKRGDTDRAISAYRMALALGPKFVAARLRLGLVYQAAGRLDEALAEFERALHDDPSASNARLLAADILARRGRVEESFRYLEHVAPDDPVYDEAQLRLGAELLKLERWSDARGRFEAFARRHHDSGAAKYYVGLTHVQEGRDDLGEAAFREAVRLDARDGQAWSELSRLAARHGRWNDARQWSSRALALDSENPGVHAIAALAAERLGDRGGAIGHYRVLLALPAGTPGAEALWATAREALTRLGVAPGGGL